MTQQRDLKIGWAFEGGGAKGSFSFAAAETLIRNEVPYHCLSGTSVGALTALLLSCNATSKGRQIWSDIQRRDVLPFKTWKLISVLRLLLVFLHSYRWTFTGRRGWPDAGLARRVLERSALACMFLPVFATALTIAMDGSWSSIAFGSGFAILIFLAIWVHSEDDWPEEERRRLLGFVRAQPALALGAVPTLVSIDLLSRFFGDGSLAARIETLPVSYGLLLGLVVHLVAVNVGDRAVLSNMPLR